VRLQLPLDRRGARLLRRELLMLLGGIEISGAVVEAAADSRGAAAGVRVVVDLPCSWAAHAAHEVRQTQGLRR
jgi:hypothetical protein